MVVVLQSNTGAFARVPDAPTLVSVAPGDGFAVATWTPPVSNGGSPVVQYIVTVNVGTATVMVRQATGTVTSVQLSPLANTTQYAVSVAAVNAIGVSPSSATLNVTPTAGTTPPPTGGGTGGTGGTPTPQPTVGQPVLAAFPVERTFRPEHWLLTAEEADAL